MSFQNDPSRQRPQGRPRTSWLSAAVVLAVWGGLWACPATAEGSAKKEPFKIVFIAYENPNQLMEDVDPVVDYLVEAMGRPIKPFVATDYAGVVEALRNGSADAAFMGGLQYVLARHHGGAEPILGEVYGGATTYRSRIFVRKDGGFKTAADLKGKTIAFVDPVSSSGYLYPLMIFKDQGLINGRDEADAFFRRIYFAGGDEQALRAVLNGFVDAAGIGQFAFDLLRGEERDQVVWIAESRSIPSHCVVVRKGLDPGARQSFKDALLALNEGPRRSLLSRLYGVDGYVEVGPETYAEVETLAAQEGFLSSAGKGAPYE